MPPFLFPFEHQFHVGAMMRCLLATLVVFVLAFSAAMSQDMVISEYYNIQDVNGEWTELLVVRDNLNAVGYTLLDANTGQVTRMGGPTFKDVPVWRHLRAGTIIVLWHRGVPAGVTADFDPADGYLEMSSRDANYFTTRLFPGAPGDADMNLADLGDVLEIIDASDAHVHALGHNKPTGAAYNAIPAPKANFDSSAVGASRSCRISGRTLGAYGIGLSKDSVVAGFNDSRGLPNRFDLARTFLGVPNINHWFWRETREPKWTATPTVSLVTQNDVSNTIEWTSLIDPYQADTTTGYIILRDTLNFASFPANAIVDGKIISKGARIGTATVLAVRPTIAGTRYVDSMNIACGFSYTYRVYGYRYRKDDLMSVTDDTTARGRQYNESTYAQSNQIVKSAPDKPTIAASKFEVCPGDTVSIFTSAIADRYEWSVNGVPLAVGGTTRVVVRDAGTYRLKIYGSGCSAISDEITIKLLPAPYVDVSPIGPHTLCSGDSVVLTTSTVAATYEWVRDGMVIPGANTKTITVRQAGDYIVRIATAAGCPGVSSVVRVRMHDVRIRTIPNVLDFGTLGACKSDTTLTLDVVNDGASTVSITDIIMPPGFALVSPPPGFSLATGKSQTVRLAFSPSGSGSFTGTVVFKAQPCGVTTTCALRGSRNAISVSVDRSQVNFGTYASCPTSFIRVDSIFSIRNSGSDSILVGVPQVTPPFYLLTAFPSAKVLAPGQDLPIQIQYRPLGADRDRGVIQQIAFPYSSRSCKDTLRAQVQAASYIPAATIDPTAIDVGMVLSCSRNIDTVIAVTNTSLVPITVTGVTGNGITYSLGSVVIDPKSTKQIPFRVSVTGATGPFTIAGQLQFDPCATALPFSLTGSLADPKYTVSTSTVDFGDILLCDTARSQSRTVTLKGTGLLGLRSRTSSVKLAAPFSSDLADGMMFTDSLIVNATFTPTALGTFSDTLAFVVGPCSAKVAIVFIGRAISRSRGVITSQTVFGPLAPGQIRDEQITITNTGTADARIEALTGGQAPFSIVSSNPPLPTTLQPQQSAVVTIRYSFVGYARRDTTIITSIMQAPCGDTVKLTFFGSTVPKDTLRGLEIVAPANLVVRAGDDVDIPLQLTSPKPLDSLAIVAMTIEMSFDPRLYQLRTVSQAPPASSVSANETSPGHIRIDIATTNPIVASNPLVTLRGSSYVGPVRSTPLVIDTAYAVGVVITGRNGKLTVVPDCEIDASTAGMGKPIVVRVTTTNDERATIDYSVLTDEEVSLKIVDIAGRMWNVPLSSTTLGMHTIQIAIDGFDSGLYNVVYRNGAHLRSAHLLITR